MNEMTLAAHLQAADAEPLPAGHHCCAQLMASAARVQLLDCLPAGRCRCIALVYTAMLRGSNRLRQHCRVRLACISILVTGMMAVRHAQDLQTDMPQPRELLYALRGPARAPRHSAHHPRCGSIAGPSCHLLRTEPSG